MEKNQSILVCVTQQKNCERLIRAAAEMKQDNGTLHVLHIANKDWNFFENIKEGEALEYLFVISKSVGAELTIVNSIQIPETIAQFAHHYGVKRIFVGESRPQDENAFLQRMTELLSDTDISIETINAYDDNFSKCLTGRNIH